MLAAKNLVVIICVSALGRVRPVRVLAAMVGLRSSQLRGWDRAVFVACLLASAVAACGAVLGQSTAMTEAEWLEGTDLQLMLDQLDGKVSERKFRLTECAFVRRFWHLLSDERSREAVEAAERFADREIDREELREAYARAEAAFEEGLRSHFPTGQVKRPFWGAAVSAAQHAASSYYDMPELFPERGERCRRMGNLVWIGTAAYPIDGDPAGVDGDAAMREEQAAQVRLLRDIFGNPFRPSSLDPLWLIPAVTSLAQSIYADSAFDRMPELADALAAAGCTEGDVLGHCRGPGPHARGCWVVDLILGKA